MTKAKKVTKIAVATGIGYKTNGKSYEYPIYTKKDLEIIKCAGGEIK